MKPKASVLLAIALASSALAQSGIPKITPGGVVNAASYIAPPSYPGSAVRVLSGGSLLTIFGEHLATSTVAATSLPLPTTLGNTTVVWRDYFSGFVRPVHLLYVSPTQINAQAPTGFWGPGPTGSAEGSFIVRVGIQESGQEEIILHDSVPDVFSMAGSDRMVAYLISAQDSLPIGPERSAQPGEVVTLYLNGLGPARSGPPGGNPLNAIFVIPDGQAAPLSPAYRVWTTPQVTVGGLSATVLFAGIAPGFVGLNQMNFIIPSDAPEGCRIPFLITGDLYSSSPAFVSVRKGGGACQDPQ